MRKKVVRTPFAKVNLRPAVMMILQEWFNLSHPADGQLMPHLATFLLDQ